MASVSGNPYATPLFLNPRQERSRGPRELTAEEAEQVQFAFSTLDSEQSGHVSRRQLKVTRAWRLSRARMLRRAAAQHARARTSSRGVAE
eukprot:356594-Chlamydomonas_euryale.AAC.8